MRLPGAALLLLHLLVARSVPALDVEVAALGAAGTVILADARFPSGVQPAMTLGILTQLADETGIGAGIAIEYDRAGASPVRDLVSYRATAGVRLRLFALWDPAGPGPRLSPSLRLGLSGSYLTYANTEVSFVVPGVFVEPLLTLRSIRVPWLRLRVGLPAVLYRRADLRFAAALGLSASLGAAARTGGAARE